MPRTLFSERESQKINFIPQRKPRISTPLLESGTGREGFGTGIHFKDAAKQLNLSIDALKKIFSCRPQLPTSEGSPDVIVILRFGFSPKEIIFEGGLSFHSTISREHLEDIARYLELRSSIRARSIVPVSNALPGGKDKKYMVPLRDFISTHLLLPPEARIPSLLFSPKLPGFRIPLEEFNEKVYCKPEFSEGIIFASRIQNISQYALNRQMHALQKEVHTYSSPKEIPFGLGLKLWIANAFYLDNAQGISPLLEKVVSDSLVREFFQESRAQYMDIFLEMDRLGRGQGQQKFWSEKTLEEKLAYAKWLIREHKISTHTLFAARAPPAILKFIRSRAFGWDEIGLQNMRGAHLKGRKRKEDTSQNNHYIENAPFPSGEDLLRENGIDGVRDSMPPPAFQGGSPLFDSIDSEELEREQFVSRSKFPGSPPKIIGSRFSSKNSTEAHEANIQTIFGKLITWKHCRKIERGQLKKIIFREIKTGQRRRIAQLLLQTGMPMRIHDELGRTPLIIAAEKHETGALEAILNFWEKPDLEQTDNSGDTALMAAASEGNANSIILLAGAGAKLDARNIKNKKRTALIFAAFEEQADTAKKLISLGANPALKDDYKRTAADYAKLNGDTKLAAYLHKQERAWRKKH